MNRMKSIIALALAALLLTSGCALAEAVYTPGAYSAVGAGFGGALTVTVTVDEEKITAVTVDEHSETEGIGSRAVEALPAAIIEANGTDVDGISGATVSSTAIKEAVDKALAQAAGEAVSMENVMIPGIFKGTALGHGSEITVAVTVTTDRILDVTVEDAHDTAWLAALPLKRIPQAIVENQSLNVDVVAGATFTSKGVIEAATAALESAGANIDALMSKPKPEKPAGEKVELEADVVVVGGGNAGIVAAAEAASHGATVIVLEKMPVVGGDSVLSGSIYNTADAELQKTVEMTDAYRKLIDDALAEEPVSEEHAQLQADVKADYDAYVASGETTLFDSANWHALQTWNGGDKVADIKLVRVLTNGAYDGLVWLEENGFRTTERLTQGTGSLYQRTHTSLTPLGTGYFGASLAAAQKTGNVTIMVDTRATELTMEDGRVNGVVAVGTQNNNTYAIKANKGVILATGGFSANVEMREQYNTSGKWPSLGEGVKTTNPPSSTGDGIAMAVAVGANLVDMDQIQLLYLANPRTGSTNALITTRAGVANWMSVNKNGERFVNETERRDVLSLALLAQPDATMYTLVNSNIWTDENLTASDGSTLKQLIDRGSVIKGETLEELAEKLGMDPAKLQASVDSFNAACDAGVDEFGRMTFGEKMLNGPWYADPRTVGVHHTMGGVQINEDAQVIDVDGNVIEGLFAAGEVTGDIHGSNRLGGNAITDTVVFGRIAGANAAK